jgi:hypothetical protein
MSAETLQVRFLVQAEVSPGLLSRLLEPFAKRDLTPDAVQANRLGETLQAEFLLYAMPAGMVHLVAGNMGQVMGVLSVEVLRDAERLAA